MQARHWIESYALLAEWHLRRLRPWLVPLLLFQLLIGAGAAIGLGFLFERVSAETAFYLSTGAPTAMLLAVGLAAVPPMVTAAKVDGTIDYMMSLPIPRLAYLAADVSVWCCLVVPGAVVSAVISSAHYGVDLDVDPLLFPIVVVMVVTASSVGYVCGLASPSPVVTSTVANLIVVCIFLASPVNFPASRLPEPIAVAHLLLPVQPTADLMRALLGSDEQQVAVGEIVVLVAWATAGLVAAHSMMRRRR